MAPILRRACRCHQCLGGCILAILVGSSLSRAHRGSVQVEIRFGVQHIEVQAPHAKLFPIISASRGLKSLSTRSWLIPTSLHRFNQPRSIVHFKNLSNHYISTYPKTCS